MSSSGIASPTAQSVWTGCIPQSGPKALPIDYDFSVATSYTQNLFSAQGQGWIEFVQSLYIDNSANGQPITIDIAQTRQHLSVPAGFCAYLPVLAPNPPNMTFTTTGGVAIRVHFLNFFMPPLVWSAT